VKSPNWDIGVQKTGFINEAGQCLVMQTKLAGRKLIMVFLDSAGKYSRIADAERIRKWLLSNHPPPRPRARPRRSARWTASSSRRAERRGRPQKRQPSRLPFFMGDSDARPPQAVAGVLGPR
jgi:D-alanyl-D-alanine carboxypeptidase